MALVGGDRRDRRDRSIPVPPGGSGPAETDEEAELIAVPAETHAVDPEVLSKAREIAARLSLPRPSHSAITRRGSGRLESLPYRGGSEDIDLDRTLAVLAERPFPDDEDIVVRERAHRRRSVVLLVDLSGSMRGERVHTTAATVGALAAQLSRDDLAVFAFWSDAAKLHGFGREVNPHELLDLLLRLPAKGLTNVAFPLQLAARELAGVPVSAGRVLLLSDCVHNAGPDPRPLAARLPRLDVLLDVSGEHDLELARELARASGGRAVPVRTHRDVAPGLQRIFS
jgi:Mg-chelatase subunit ChlD